MNPRLRVEVGMQVGSEYELPPPHVESASWLGRGGMCLIQLADQQLSRRHCRFTRVSDRVYVEDLESRNGTRVNGLVTDGRVEVAHGDRITAGSHELILLWPGTGPGADAEKAKLGTPAELEAAHQQIADIVGTDFGGYHIERIIRPGKTSTLLSGRALAHDVPVAIKVLEPLAKISVADEDRFIQGARLAASLRHEHFARVFKGGQSHGLYFVAMQYVGGQNVAETVDDRGGPMGVKFAVEVIRQVLDGLQHMHEKGLMFGGIYADNVIIGDGLKVKLVDFDLVRKIALNAEGGRDTTFADSPPRSMHVDYRFAAPEEIAFPDSSEAKSDVFSAGALFYFMLCGRPPFTTDLPGPRLSSAFSRRCVAPRVLNPAIPDAMGGVIMQSMSDYSRFNTCDEMLAAVDHAMEIGRS
jgi:serine/threonine protein kinase